jgi:protein TonB
MLLVVTAAAAWYLRRPSPPESPEMSVADAAAPAADTAKPSAVQSLVSAASDALNSVADRGLRAIGLAPEAAPTAEGPPPAPAAGGSSSRARRGPATGASVAPGATMPTPIAIAEVPLAVTLPVVAADPEEALEFPAESGVFSLADSDVDPPLLVRPQLPREPQTGAPGAASFELLVTERGEGEQVRLHAAVARLQDRMMVSAAKAWRFRPATKDGRPVRYTLRIPITQ